MEHWRAMGLRARRKGHSYEREIANRLKPFFPDACRQLEYQEGLGVDLANTGRYKIQLKRYKDYAPISKINEAVGACKNHTDVPILITKGDRKEDMVVMPLGHFLELQSIYKEYTDGKIAEGCEDEESEYLG